MELELRVRRRRRTSRDGAQSGTIGNILGVIRCERREALIVSNICESAGLLVRETGPVFEVHGDGGRVVEFADAGLIRACDFDTLAW